MPFDPEAFRAIWHPADPDGPPSDAVLAYYRSKYDLVAGLQPDSICEIGVRAGYSGWCFTQAAPQAKYTGMDIDDGRWGGKAGFIEHAKRILDGRVHHGNSLDVSTMGGYQFWHVDGDHSVVGCLSDLLLARRCAAKWILIDDVDFIPEVLMAVNMFAVRFGTEAYAEACPDAPEFTMRAIDDGGYRGQVLFERIAA